MVLRWTTGYPFGVSLSRGYPRFNPGEFSTVDLIVRGDNDAALVLGADPGATMHLKSKGAAGSRIAVPDGRRADVLLENFSPGTMDGLGVGWSRLHEINPRLIYASGTGFGLSGPDRDNLAMDMTIQAASGIMSVPVFRTARRSRPARPWSISWAASTSMPAS